MEERELYMRLIAFCSGPAIEVVQLFFEVKVLCAQNLNIQSFLDDKINKHVLFHAYVSRTQCCECSKPPISASLRRLNSSQFLQLYDNSKVSIKGHEIKTNKVVTQHCICKFSSKISVTVDTFDILLLFEIFECCCTSKLWNLTLLKYIKDIKLVKNNLWHVARMPDRFQFENHWKTLEEATLGLAGEIGNTCLKRFRRQIFHLKTCSEERITECVEGSHRTTEGINMLINDKDSLEIGNAFIASKPEFRISIRDVEKRIEELCRSLEGTSKLLYSPSVDIGKAQNHLKRSQNPKNLYSEFLKVGDWKVKNTQHDVESNALISMPEKSVIDPGEKAKRVKQLTKADGLQSLKSTFVKFKDGKDKKLQQDLQYSELLSIAQKNVIDQTKQSKRVQPLNQADGLQSLKSTFLKFKDGKDKKLQHDLQSSESLSIAQKNDIDQTKQSKRVQPLNQDPDSFSLESKARDQVFRESQASTLLSNTDVVSNEVHVEIKSVGEMLMLLTVAYSKNICKRQESLLDIIQFLKKQIDDTGKINTSADSAKAIKLTFTSNITGDERRVLQSMFSGLLDKTQKNIQHDLHYVESASIAGMNTICPTEKERYNIRKEYGTDGIDKENPESRKKVLNLKFEETMQTRTRSSSLSKLNMSIKDENELEKEWFYKLKLTCNKYSLHLINDFNIQRTFGALSEAVQSNGHTKLTGEHSTNAKNTTAFERMYQHMICNKQLLMSDCIKQNLDMAARFLLARNIAPNELVKFLQESMKENRNAISKAIGWNITKQFCKVILSTEVVSTLIDIWPGFRCRCGRHHGKGHSKICSIEPIIIVEVDQFSNAIPKDFYGIPVKQSFPELEDENTKVQCLEENTDTSSFMDSVKQTPVSIPGELAEMCFKKHSKMTMMHVHPLRRRSIQLWGQIKGVIPMGEAHFPKMINGKDTCIAEGHVKFMAKIKVGDTIGVPGSTGTLGGFVQMHGYNAFLTCAHVVHNKETLFAGNKRERHKTKTEVFCVDTLNPNSRVKCGYVLNEVFDFNDAKETSVDAAVVVLNVENVKFDEDDILNKSPSGPVKADFLGMQGPYLNDNYITPKTLRGTVKAKCVGMTSGYSDNDVTFEDYDKDDDQFKNKSHGLSLYFKSIKDHVGDIKREYLGSLAIPYEVHFQHLVVRRLGEEIKSGRLYFRFFNQLLLENFVFKQGDSGTCIYVVEDKTIVRSDNQPNPTGCLAMAIASFYDSNERRNKCIATPMKAILKRLGLI